MPNANTLTKIARSTGTTTDQVAEVEKFVRAEKRSRYTPPVTSCNPIADLLERMDKAIAEGSDPSAVPTLSD